MALLEVGIGEIMVNPVLQHLAYEASGRGMVELHIESFLDQLWDIGIGCGVPTLYLGF